MPDLHGILVHFSPEIILVTGAIVVLAYDLVVRGRDGAQPWLAGLVLLAALSATLCLYVVPPPTSAPFAITGSDGSLAAACSGHEIFEVVSDASGAVVRCGSFVSDSFTQFFRLASAVAGLLVVLSGLTFMGRRTPFKGEFYAILLFATLAMNLMAGANDLIVMALSLEFLSISSYVLTAFLRGDSLSIEGGLKYFLYGSIAGAVMLFGLSMIYGATGSTSLPAVAAALGDAHRAATTQMPALVAPALLLILVGVSFKIALVPFHMWSPDAYEGAPTPVTSFLSVGPKLAGFAVLLRLLSTAFGDSAYSSEWVSVLTAIAVMTMVLGNVVAISQTNVKRMMAYSSIAQAGYVSIGVVAAGTIDGRTGAWASVLVFLLAYLFTNLGAFAVIIAVDDATGSSDIAAFSGLWRRSPLLAAALAVFFLSLVGVPPLAGFIGKFSVFSAAVSAGHVGLALVAVATGVISVGYYFRVLRMAFFEAPQPDIGRIRVPPQARLAVVVALVMTLVIGIYAGPFIAVAHDAASAIAPATQTVIGTGGGS